MELVLSNLTAQQLPGFVAGDRNIGLTKCITSTDTADSVEVLLTNNFMPVIVMPTRITSQSATLIDHIYYFEGAEAKDHVKIRSGNFSRRHI